MNPLISKARRPKFELILRIIDLNNVPLVTGTSFIKWHLPSSTSAEHRGRTEHEPIREHKVSWNYTKTLPVRLTIDKSNNLTECFINFEVVQDYSSSIRGEKITLGYVALNLAEYVEETEMGAETEEGVVRRYLMQDSKINSTLKIGISMKQIDGERSFTAPPLKTAAVFGGIAGLMAPENEQEDLVGMAMPSMHKNRDLGELQDVYRRSLAAAWTANSEELPADKCIEDIFNGGNGWSHAKGMPRVTAHFEDDHMSDERTGHHYRHQRTPSGASGKSAISSKSQSTVTTGQRRGHKHSKSQDTMGMSPGVGMDSEGSSDRGRIGGVRRAKEVHEFDARDDLIAWKLPDKVF